VAISRGFRNLSVIDSKSDLAKTQDQAIIEKHRRRVMKIIRSICVAAALLVLAGGILRAQEILFGSEPIPSVTDALQNIPIKGHTWTIHVSRKGATRLIRINGLGPEKSITADLVCSQGIERMDNTVWAIAKGDCQLRFKPEGDVGPAPVKLKVEAAALESSRIFSSADSERALHEPVAATIILEGAEHSGSDAKRSDIPGRGFTDRNPLTFVIFGIILAVVVIMIWLFLQHRKNTASATGASGTKGFDEQEKGHGPGQVLPSLAAIGKIPIQEVVRHQGSEFPVVASVQERAVEKTLTEHSNLLLDLSSKVQNLEGLVQEVADNFESRLGQNARQAEEVQFGSRNDTTRLLHEMDSRIAMVDRKLSEHLAAQSSRLQDLFRDLPALADLTPIASVINKSELSRLEDALVAASKQSALPNERLEALQDESSRLVDALQEFGGTAEKISKDQARKRLARVAQRATATNSELLSLSQLAATQMHGFFVEMSLLEESHLADDLAAALTREAAKVGDPEGYYVKRLKALAAHACAAGIDFADLDVDAERRNAGLQQALGKLLRALGMTPIDPHQSDKLQAAEHQVVQFARRVPGVQPGTIAHTIARGLQRGDEVMRKASVLLYE
jgi:hypothetical protein